MDHPVQGNDRKLENHKIEFKPVFVMKKKVFFLSRCVVQMVYHTPTCADLNMLDAEIKRLDSIAVVIAEFARINLNRGHIDRESGQIGHDLYSGQIDLWKSKGRR